MARAHWYKHTIEQAHESGMPEILQCDNGDASFCDKDGGVAAEQAWNAEPLVDLAGMHEGSSSLGTASPIANAGRSRFSRTSVSGLKALTPCRWRDSTAA